MDAPKSLAASEPLDATLDSFKLEDDPQTGDSDYYLIIIKDAPRPRWSCNSSQHRGGPAFGSRQSRRIAALRGRLARRRSMTRKRWVFPGAGVLLVVAALGLEGRPTVEKKPEGLITKKSALSPGETMDRLEAAVRGKGLTVFARVDHSGGAASVGMPLRFTQLLIFGNPKGGTPLMQSRQTIGIDLPLKILVWQDEPGDVWVSYQDPAYLAARHEITDRADSVSALAKALESLVTAVASPGN
jgi:uncharacterized protein (DUF302 family)